MEMEPHVIEEDVEYDTDRAIDDKYDDEEEDDDFVSLYDGEMDSQRSLEEILHQHRHKRKKRKLTDRVVVKSPVHPDLKVLAQKFTTHCYSHEFRCELPSQLEHHNALLEYFEESKCFCNDEKVQPSQEGSCSKKISTASQSIGNQSDHVVNTVNQINTKIIPEIKFCREPRTISDAMCLSSCPKMLLTARAPFSVVHVNRSALQSLPPWNSRFLRTRQRIDAAVKVLIGGLTKNETSVLVSPVLSDCESSGSLSSDHTSCVLYALVELIDQDEEMAKGTQLVG